MTGRVETFDLALVKRIDTELTPGPYLAGSPVSFEIEVFNQGEVAAYQVEITDYLPNGLVLNDGDCVLIYTADDSRRKLSDTRCIAE